MTPEEVAILIDIQKSVGALDKKLVMLEELNKQINGKFGMAAKQWVVIVAVCTLLVAHMQHPAVTWFCRILKILP